MSFRRGRRSPRHGNVRQRTRRKKPARERLRFLLLEQLEPRMLLSASSRGGMPYVDLGTSDNVAWDQPRVAVEFVTGEPVNVTPSTVLFTSANYQTPQELTVSAIDDHWLEGLHTGTIMQLPFALRATMGLFSLAALALLALGWLVKAQTGAAAKALGAARIAIGAGLALFAFPVLFWLGYEGDIAPARAFAFLGFWVAALFVAGLTLAAGRAPWRRAVTGAGAAGILAVAAYVRRRREIKKRIDAMSEED